MASAGPDWRTNPKTQIKWGLNYIEHRYGDPVRAWAHSQRTGWYREGAWNIKQDELAVVHQGEMVVPSRVAHVLRQAVAAKTAPTSGGGQTVLNFGANSIVIQLGTGTSTPTAAARSAA